MGACPRSFLLSGDRERLRRELLDEEEEDEDDDDEVDDDDEDDDEVDDDDEGRDALAVLGRRAGHALPKACCRLLMLLL